MKYLFLVQLALWCITVVFTALTKDYFATFLSCCCIIYCYTTYSALQSSDYWRGRWSKIVVRKDE